MYKKITTVEEYSDYLDQSPAMPNANSKLKNYAPCVRVDVPLLIKLLEYAREEASSDLDLHILASKMLAISENGGRVLTIDDYHELMEFTEEEKETSTTN